MNNQMNNDVGYTNYIQHAPPQAPMTGHKSPSILHLHQLEVTQRTAAQRAHDEGNEGVGMATQALPATPSGAAASQSLQEERVPVAKALRRRV